MTTNDGTVVIVQTVWYQLRVRKCCKNDVIAKVNDL